MRNRPKILGNKSTLKFLIKKETDLKFEETDQFLSFWKAETNKKYEETVLNLRKPRFFSFWKNGNLSKIRGNRSTNGDFYSFWTKRKWIKNFVKSI